MLGKFDDASSFKSEKKEEFDALVEEIRSLGFQRSCEVSRYIIEHRLGSTKYPHISGHLEMSKNGDTWTLDGGFPGLIYSKLCTELGLENNGSGARAGRFTSYSALNNPNG